MIETTQKSSLHIKQALFPEMSTFAFPSKFNLADIAMILFISQRAFSYIFSTIFGMKGIFFFMLSLVILYFSGILSKMKKGDNIAVFSFFSILLFMGILVFVSLLRHADLKFWIFGSEWNLITQIFDPRKALFGLLTILLVRNFDKILRNLYIASVITFIYLLYQAVLFEIFNNWNAYFNINASSSRYNMSFGYEMIFVGIILLSIAMKKGSVFLFTMGSMAVGFSIYYGSRGVIFLLLAYMFLIFFCWSGNSWKITKQNRHIKGKRLLSFVLVILIAIFIMLVLLPNLSKCINYLYPSDRIIDTAADNDAVPRTLQAIAKGELLANNGRFSIWKLSLRAFLDNPIFGQGFYGDRLYVGQGFVWGYSHNIVLELMSQFGIWGLIGLLLLLIYTIRLLNEYKSDSLQLSMIIFGAMCFKLLLSDSYIIYSHFWAYIGLLILSVPLSKKSFKWIHLEKDHLMKIKKYGFAFLCLTFILSFSLFVHKDYQEQKFKTIKFESPKILLTTSGEPKSLPWVQSLAQNKNIYFETFLSASIYKNLFPFEEQQEKASAEIRVFPDFSPEVSNYCGFQDGNYYYENPYIMPLSRQESNRRATLEFFKQHAIPEPIAFLPPYNENNSTIQYRSMHQYKFIQTVKQDAMPYTKITYPDTLALKAMPLTAENFTDKKIIFNYLEEALRKKGLAILHINTQKINAQQLSTFFDQIKDMGFETISFADLAETGFVNMPEKKTFSFKNYIENTYLYNTLYDYMF